MALREILDQNTFLNEYQIRIRNTIFANVFGKAEEQSGSGYLSSATADMDPDYLSPTVQSHANYSQET